MGSHETFPFAGSAVAGTPPTDSRSADALLGYITARVERIEQATPLVKVFTLQADPQQFSAHPGQWLDLAIRCEGEVLVAGYSLVSAPSSDGRLELAIKDSERHPATRHLHRSCRVGDTVHITSGQGEFYFLPGMARHVVLLGGGIGVTPLFSILRYIRAELPEVHAHLVYSAVSRDEVLFADELARMAQEPNIDVTLTVTREAEDWQGHTGRIGHRLLESLDLSPQALYYFCGARPFIEDICSLLHQRGIPEEQLRYEKWW